MIVKSGLLPYTLCADTIRLEIGCLSVIDGKLTFDQSRSTEVWELLFERLIARMEEGLFTVIDATNTTSAEMQIYLDFAVSYGYIVKLVDLSDVPKDVCISRNAKRTPAFKIVPEKFIDKMYARCQSQKIPDGIMVYKPLWKGGC